jgi:hypothetical protein
MEQTIIEKEIENFNHYPSVKKAISVFESCKLYSQRVNALVFAKLAIERDVVKPTSRKPEHLMAYHNHKDCLFNFFESMVNRGGFEV